MNRLGGRNSPRPPPPPASQKNTSEKENEQRTRKNSSTFIRLKDKKFQFTLKIGWRALAGGEPTKTFSNWRKGGDSNPRGA